MKDSTTDRVFDLLRGGSAQVGQLAATLELTPQAVLYHLHKLRARNLVVLVGRGRTARWARTTDFHFVWPREEVEARGEAAIWQEVKTEVGDGLGHLSPAAMTILNYAVTEMLNNAFDHSDASSVELDISLAPVVTVIVRDDGVGAFARAREFFGLSSELEAIAHIAKGQQTTKPEHHSGQGMFFSSRAVDVFTVTAGGRSWTTDNLRDDTAVVRAPVQAGTSVTMVIDPETTRVLRDVFLAHSLDDDRAFDKGAMRVSLVAHGTEFVSRSEAKRLAVGLELYGSVELDFGGVVGVGQGFVDELFRVWVNANPGTELTYVNANEEVAFMIERGLPRR